MRKIKLYLAHPFDFRKQAREWEIEIEKRIGIEIINPFYDVKREDIEKIDLGRTERYEKLDYKELVERDVNQIVTSDGIIAMVTGHLSYGTIQEMVYAHSFHVPVYSLITNGHENHPWLKYHSDKIFTKIKSLEDFLCNLKK